MPSDVSVASKSPRGGLDEELAGEVAGREGDVGQHEPASTQAVAQEVEVTAKSIGVHVQ